MCRKSASKSADVHDQITRSGNGCEDLDKSAHVRLKFGAIACSHSHYRLTSHPVTRSKRVISPVHDGKLGFHPIVSRAVDSVAIWPMAHRDGASVTAGLVWGAGSLRSLYYLDHVPSIPNEADRATHLASQLGFMDYRVLLLLGISL